MTDFGWIDASQPPWLLTPNYGSDLSPQFNYLFTAGVLASGGAHVQLAPGTYYVNEVCTHNYPFNNPDYDPSPPVYIHGAGMDSTILIASESTAFTFGLTGAGGLFDLTIDGGGLTTVTCVNGNAAVTGIADHLVFERVKVRNNDQTEGTAIFTISATVVNPATALALSNGTVYMNDMRIEQQGQNGGLNDMMEISVVDTCYFRNLTIENGQRSPNFYIINRLLGQGLRVNNIRNIPGCFIQYGTGCFVIDASCAYAHIDNLTITDVNFDMFVNGPNTRIDNAYLECGIRLLNSAQGGPTLSLNQVFEANNVECTGYIVGGYQTDAATMAVNHWESISITGGAINVNAGPTPQTFAIETNMRPPGFQIMENISMKGTKLNFASVLAASVLVTTGVFSSATGSGANLCTLRNTQVTNCLVENLNVAAAIVDNGLVAIRDAKTKFTNNGVGSLQPVGTPSTFTAAPTLTNGVAVTNQYGYDALVKVTFDSPSSSNGVTLTYLNSATQAPPISSLVTMTGPFFVPVGAKLTVSYPSGSGAKGEWLFN